MQGRLVYGIVALCSVVFYLPTSGCFVAGEVGGKVRGEVAGLVEYILMAEGLPDNAANGAGLPPPGDASNGGLSVIALLVEVVVIVLDVFEDGFVGCVPLPDEDFLLGYFGHHETVIGLPPVSFL